VTDEEGFRRIIYAAGPMDKVNILIEESWHTTRYAQNLTIR
jgi:hypothetical protein